MAYSRENTKRTRTRSKFSCSKLILKLHCPTIRIYTRAEIPKQGTYIRDPILMSTLISFIYT